MDGVLVLDAGQRGSVLETGEPTDEPEELDDEYDYVAVGWRTVPAATSVGQRALRLATDSSASCQEGILRCRQRARSGQPWSSSGHGGALRALSGRGAWSFSTLFECS